eukprot:TRINITY_DN1595_c0_g1_i2.p1 TRINITY_DN1595_c0_g1~~TRINITY_DN1595_c0_g1_i2.p1  ORF type:complete len:127 (-),score=22.75 TRINITY_DN1595_c0_g1_i2:20-400(-)
MQIKLIPVPSEEEDDFYDLEKDFSSGDEETEEPPSVSASVLLEEFENDADLEKVFLPSQSEPISESPDILIPVDQVISVEEVPLAAQSMKTSLMNAFALVHLTRIQEFHLSPNNMNIPDCLYLSLE